MIDHPLRARVAEVLVTRPGEQQTRGSGYLVSPGWVLTVWHVVDRAASIGVWFGAPSELTLDAGASVEISRVLTIPVADLALLPVTGSVQDGPTDPALFGRLDRESGLPVPVVAVGCPRFKLHPVPGRPDALLRDLHYAIGSIVPLSDAKTHQFAFTVDVVPGPDPDPDPDPDEHSPWEGMSGAGVWGSGRLIGVVGQHYPREGLGVLTVRSIEQLFRHASEMELTAWRAALPQLPSTAEDLTLAAPPTPQQITLRRARQAAEALAPRLLIGRSAELAALQAFTDSDPRWRWIQGDAFAGKTALMAWFVLHPPDRVEVAACFLRRTTSENTADYALNVLTRQLVLLAGRHGYRPPEFLSERTDDFFDLLEEANRACADSDRRLLVLIDGLDEYDPTTSRFDLAAWLPDASTLPSPAKLLVTSRAGADALIPPAHPVSGSIQRITASAAATEIQDTAQRELGSALKASVSLYLAAMVGWLNMDPWPRDNRFAGPALTPAAIERKLRLVDNRHPGRPSVDADDLAGSCERLVVLGGPGSGKTWLARRIARRCAENALSALAEGAPIGEVELPLYTTCSRLFTAKGVIREAAISSALEQLGDLGGSLKTATIRQHFLERDGPTLFVIDSLDEAYGSDERLRQADTLPWRVVLTTRPSSWNEQLKIQDQNEAHCIGELLPLRYPDDVDTFIRRWFEERPNWAESIVTQIARRPDLQRAATVPLILAFYCIVGGSQPLPDTRRELYTEVIVRMLTGRWRGSRVNDNRQHHVRICLQVLRDWAWSGTLTQSASGVSLWTDEILTEPCELAEVDAQALDHVAVPISPPDLRTGKILRRFIHRSIREHLVAEYVANQPAEQAAQMLLPHLWYDRDWQYSAPSALVIHPQHNQLLWDLMRLAVGSEQPPGGICDVEAGWEFRQFLARVATESNETDWSREATGIIGQARVELAMSGRVDDLGGAASWRTSNRKARDALLRILIQSADVNAPPDLVDKDPADLVDGFIQLVATAQDKRLARETLLRLSADQEDGALAAAALSGVIQLDPTTEDLRRSQKTLLRLLPTQTDETSVSRVVDTIVRLATTAEDKRQGREALLHTLVNQSRWSLMYPMVGGMVQLAATADDKGQARGTLLKILSDQHDGFVTKELAEGVMQLDPTAQDVRQVRKVLLRSLSSQTQGYMARALVTTLIQLTPTTQDKNQARRALLNLLTLGLASQYGVSQAANALRQLEPTIEDKRLAREVLRRRLANYQVWLNADGSTLVGELTRLDPTAEERYLVRDLLLEMLPNQTQGYAANGMVAGLIKVLATPEEKREVRDVLLRILATHNDSGIIGSLAGGVAKLEPSPEDLQQARNTLIRILVSQTNGGRADSMTYYLLLLNPTAADKRQARNSLIRILASRPRDGWTSTIASRLVELAETAENKRQARDALLRWVARRIRTPDGEDPNPVMNKVALLDPTVRDLRACGSWPISPSAQLLSAVRQNSALADWLAFLPSLPA